MTRKTLSAGKGKVAHKSLFAKEEEMPSAPASSPEERCIRLQRQLTLLQREYGRLAEENRRLSDAASLSPEGYCEVDSRGMILSVNAVFAALVQTEAHSLRGTAFVTFLPDNFHQPYLSFIHHVIHSGGSHAIDLAVVSPAGTERHVHIDSRVSMRGRSPVVLCVVTPAERGSLPPAAGGQEEFFRMQAEYSSSLTMWFSTDGALLWVNKAVEPLTGYSPQECYAIPDFPYPLVAPEDQVAVTELSAEALHGGEELDREIRFHRKDGQEMWAAVSYHPVFAADGTSLGVCATARSIEKRKRLEEEMTAVATTIEERIRIHTDALHKKNRALHKDVEWHISMKKQLEASERQFRMLWERSFDGMKLVDESGTTVLVNNAYCKLAGMPRDMLIGKPATIIYAPEERAFFTTLSGMYKGTQNETMILERQMRLWDDRVVWLELLTTPFPGEENQKFMLLIVRDITARKRSEEKITLLNTALENRLQDRLAELDVMNTRLSAEMRERIESEEWIRNFLHHCPIVMYIKDARACMVMANKNFESMFGMNPNAIIGKTNAEVWGQELGEVLDQQDFDVLKNGAPKEYLDTINGRNYLTIKFPINRKELPPLLGSYVQDVTDILAEERAMKLSRQFFERIVNALGDLVVVKDSRRRYVLVNDSFVDFTGLDRTDIIGRTDHEIFNADTADMIVSGDDAVFEKQREFLIEELMPRSDGMQRRILVKKDIYFDENDQPFIVNVIRDITELRKEEEEIRTALAREKELSELKSRFVSMVSHEYKTPLTAILSSAELLELFRKSWSDEKVNGHLQKIKRAVETMIEMISDALFLNKMDTGRLIVSPNTFELVSFCIMIADEIQACAPVQNKIEFSSNITNAVVSVDNKLLRYIFTNLLSNAVKYSFANSAIQFDVIVTRQTGVFRIRNRGIGIPREHRERLFEPFFRAPNTGTIQGTGLGLSIVKRCVDALEGEIAVESVQNGETIFTVTLPMPVVDQRPGIAYPHGAEPDG